MKINNNINNSNYESIKPSEEDKGNTEITKNELDDDCNAIIKSFEKMKNLYTETNVEILKHEFIKEIHKFHISDE